MMVYNPPRKKMALLRRINGEKLLKKMKNKKRQAFEMIELFKGATLSCILRQNS